MKQTKTVEFTSLYTQQFPKIVQSLIVRYRITREVAEDLVQNVLTDTWAVLKDCDDSNASDVLSIPYIYKICKNRAAKYISDSIRYEMVPLYYNDEDSNDIISSTLELDAWEHQDSELTAEALKSSRMKAIKHHLRGLSAEHRALILRRMLKHESYKDLAESLGFKNSDVCKQIVSRQLNRIRKKIREEEFTFAA